MRGVFYVISSYVKNVCPNCFAHSDATRVGLGWVLYSYRNHSYISVVSGLPNKKQRSMPNRYSSYLCRKNYACHRKETERTRNEGRREKKMTRTEREKRDRKRTTLL